MPVGSPTFRPLSGSDRLVSGAWGTQPSGPLMNIGGPKLSRGAGLPGVHARTGGNSTPSAFGLPAKETLDYVNSLTSTTLLLIGLGAFLLFHKSRPATVALRKLQGRVT
jgi:hypothetical protein